ncbi:MAG: restriction endonuclease subunit S [Ruminococcus sp.]|nr:restriction endonuclease subunit S [Ruminococcus sp.]
MKSDVAKRIESINNGIIPEGYKKTKVGIMPVEWERYKLSDISDELTEKAGNKTYETLSISAGIGFVNQANKFGKELSGKQYEKYIVLRKGEFSYNKGNSKKYPQGCIYQLKDRDEAAVPNVFESFHLNKGINDFYEQLFVSGFLNCQLFAKINHGVRDDGLLNLKGEDFYSCYVPFPPLPEQQKIAEILSTQDKLIELQECKINQLKTLKKGYLQKMFPKKGCNYPELRFKGFTDPWEQRKLSEISDIVTGTTPPTKDKENYGGNRLFVSPADIQGNRYIDKTTTTLTEKGFALGRELRDGTTLFVSIGSTIGKVAQIKDSATTNQQINAVIPNDDMSDDFVFTMLENEADKIKKLAATQAVPIINKTTFGETEISYPKKGEQQQIGSYFRNLDHLITLHQRKLDEEKQKKKALMQLLLTGKVRVKL